MRYDRSEIGAVNVDLSTGTATGAWNGNAFTHTLLNVEEVRGSRNDNDTITGGSENNVFYGRGGDDSLVGNDGDDVLNGEDGSDTLLGGAGNDTMHGGNGDDFINPGDNTYYDEIFAGAGNDVVDLSEVNLGYAGLLHSDLNAGIIANIDGVNNTGTINKGANGVTTIIGVASPMVVTTNYGGFGLEGTAFNDSMNLSVVAGGWMLVRESGGDDTIEAAASNAGTIRLDYFYGTNGMVADLSTGVVSDDGTGGTDMLIGHFQEVRSTDYNDSIIGSDLDDRVILREGNDTFDGGLGFDTVRYDRSGVSGLNVDLGTGTATGTWNGNAFSDTLLNVEGLRGSYLGNDTLTGGAEDNAFYGRGGDDSLVGNGGNDTLNGEDGNDTLIGGAGDDDLTAYLGDDRLEAGDGDDTINVFNGAGDYMDGGAGRDIMFFDASGTPAGSYAVTFDLTTGFLYNTADPSESDRFFNIEEIQFTGAIDTTIIGNGAANYFFTGDGDDTITGALGDDSMHGGGGTDTVVINDDYRTASDDLNVQLSMSATGLMLGSADGNDLIGETVEFVMFNDQTVTRDALVAEIGTPIINGTGTNINGTSATEIINGTPFDNWINPGGGSDTIDGDDGRDMVSFYNLADTPGRTNVDYRLDIDMQAGTAVNHDGSEQIAFSNVERITTTIYADRIRGTDGDDEIRALGNYDWIIATEGNDTIDGGSGQDMISFLEYQSSEVTVVADVFSANGLPPSGAQATGVVIDLANSANNTALAEGLTLTSVERITGSSRQDVFYGDDGENDFRGLGGYDWFVSSTGGRERYYGGSGTDTVTYYNASSGVTANLSNGAVTNGRETGYGSVGDARSDLYVEIENLVGSRFDDELRGSSERNQLSGLEGDDFLFGYGGVDYLMGGLGNDVIDGGGGSDYALFTGNAANYTLTRSGNNVTVVGADGTDQLIDVEYFRFDDGDVTIWDL
ncbi:hypothetical protein N4R57_19955 [Rhodobacteraceae bacterium D3-12]|nr:hypothetical protein N4R57_19955 [Rhodobacteraceae bacterium D3-12]